MSLPASALCDSALSGPVPAVSVPAVSAVDETWHADDEFADPEISAWLDVSPARRPVRSTAVRVMSEEHGDYLGMQAGTHAAMLYRSESDLVAAVVRHLTDGLADGDIIALVVTPARRRRLLDALPLHALQKAEQEDRVVLLDAEETLARFVRDGEVDAELFERHVAASFRRLARGTSWVTAYGEMTTLLWTAGDVVGALRLERLWTDLQRNTPFSMLCAYPTAELSDAQGDLSELCRVHTEVHAH